MFCQKCGQEVSDYTRICPACGELLDSNSNTPQLVQPNNNNTDNRNAFGNGNENSNGNNNGNGNSNGNSNGNWNANGNNNGNSNGNWNANGNYNNYNPSPANAMPQIPDYKVQSILLIVFSVLCCFTCIGIAALPFAILALVNSNKIAIHLMSGNPGLAQEASKKTKTWCWVSFIILMVSLILSVVYSIFLVNSSEYQNMLEQIMDMQYQYDFSN